MQSIESAMLARPAVPTVEIALLEDDQFAQAKGWTILASPIPWHPHEPDGDHRLASRSEATFRMAAAKGDNTLVLLSDLCAQGFPRVRATRVLVEQAWAAVMRDPALRIIIICTDPMDVCLCGTMLGRCLEGRKLA